MFTGRVRSDAAFLGRWKTKKEEESAKLRVERSCDAIVAIELPLG